MKNVFSFTDLTEPTTDMEDIPKPSVVKLSNNKNIYISHRYMI